MTVEEFIAAEAGEAFTWGRNDCASLADRWVNTVTGVSPMAALGRRHRDEAQAREWLAERGSLAVAMNRAMRAAGFAKTEKPRAGDVGLIVHGEKLCIAIFTGTMWVSRDADGLIGEPPGACWKAWRIECQ